MSQYLELCSIIAFQVTCTYCFVITGALEAWLLSSGEAAQACFCIVVIMNY